MALFLSYSDTTATQPPRQLAFSVVDVQTGNVWSPSAKAFVPPAPAAPAVAPADALVPLTRMSGANWATILLGYLPDVPWPPEPGRYIVFPHLAAGGPPVDEPFSVGSQVARKTNIAVQVSQQ